jgi:hypothetical protein
MGGTGVRGACNWLNEARMKLLLLIADAVVQASNGWWMRSTANSPVQHAKVAKPLIIRTQKHCVLYVLLEHMQTLL